MSVYYNLLGDIAIYFNINIHKTEKVLRTDRKKSTTTTQQYQEKDYALDDIIKGHFAMFFSYRNICLAN